MEISQDLRCWISVHLTLQETLKRSKDEVETILRNKDLSLDERWEWWLTLPDDLKNHAGDLVNDGASKLGPAGIREEHYRTGGMDWPRAERHQVNRIDELDDYNVFDDWTPEQVAEFRENVLKYNLASVTFDW